MGYELRQRLTGPHDSWVAVDPSSGREVLAHRMSDPASADLLPLVMQVLLGKNESARATVLDFVQQDGGWLLVTVDSPGHREIRQWLQGSSERQATTPAIDPIAITQILRGTDSQPLPAAGAPALESPPPVGEFTRFFVAGQGQPDGERTKLYSTAGSAPDAAPAPPLEVGEFTRHFVASDPAPVPPPQHPMAESHAGAAAVHSAGEFTQYFAREPQPILPEPARAEEPTQRFASYREGPPSGQVQAGEFTQYFAGEPHSLLPEPAHAKDVTPQFAPYHEEGPSPAQSQAGEFTQYFAGDTTPVQPQALPVEATFDRFAAHHAAPRIPAPVPAAVGEFTRILNSTEATPPQLPSPPAARVATPPAAAQEKPANRISPVWLVSGVILLRAVALVAGLILFR